MIYASRSLLADGVTQRINPILEIAGIILLILIGIGLLIGVAYLLTSSAIPFVLAAGLILIGSIVWIITGNTDLLVFGFGLIVLIILLAMIFSDLGG